jgi:hypothetical protein
MSLFRRLVLRQYGTGVGVRYLLRDLFTTDRAAGAVNGTAAEPGPGLRTVTDTENKLSISGGKQVFSGGKTVPAHGDPGSWYESVLRVIGKTLLARVTPQAAGVAYIPGWSTVASGLANDAVKFDSAAVSFYENTIQAIVGAFVGGTEYTVALSMRGAGLFYLIKGGIYTEWTLLWVSSFSTISPCFPALSNHSKPLTVDDMRIVDLPAPWNTDYGLATQRLAGARAAGNTFTHEANCLIEFTVATLPTISGGIYFDFRQQDSTHTWRVVCRDTGVLDLQEVDGGAPISRSTTGAGTVANGHRVVIIADGATIKAYSNNVLRWTYTFATNFQTTTQGKLVSISTGGAVSDIVSWPRTISGAALSALNRA